MSELAPPVVILDKPQLADNIGAVARVMANFGLSELRLVTPRDGWPQDRAWAAASGADWVLEGVRVFDSVAEAIADLNTVFSTTARPRETRMPVRTPRESARLLYDDTASGLKTGLLFGGERAGLETTDIALTAGITTIPIDRLMMITDSVAASWIVEGEISLGGLAVVVKDGIAKLKEGGALAGSTLLANEGFRNLVGSTGLPLHEVIKVTSWNQARSLGLEGLGKIAPGFFAYTV